MHERTPAPAERLVDAVAGFSRRSIVTPVNDRLAGWLGHPVHPMLTDLPIGFWTSSVVLDLLHRSPRASRTLLGMGVVSAAPTAVTGLGDLPYLDGTHRRWAGVHIVANTVAVLCFAASWMRRWRDPSAGRFCSAAGTLAATAAGWAGGAMAFGKSDESE